MAGFSFNVAFGINETSLTRALESRSYEKALEYIDSRYGACLDEGFYQRTPLFIVLSREKSRCDGKAMPVHLKIARRLVERGKQFFLFIFCKLRLVLLADESETRKIMSVRQLPWQPGVSFALLHSTCCDSSRPQLRFPHF